MHVSESVAIERRAAPSPMAHGCPGQRDSVSCDAEVSAASVPTLPHSDQQQQLKCQGLPRTQESDLRFLAPASLVPGGRNSTAQRPDPPSIIRRSTYTSELPQTIVTHNGKLFGRKHDGWPKSQWMGDSLGWDQVGTTRVLREPVLTVGEHSRHNQPPPSALTHALCAIVKPGHYSGIWLA